MSRDDVMAIRAYLDTVEPVHQPVVANTLPFPFNIRAAMRVWDALYFTEGEFKPDPQKSAEWNRGAFLVQGPGHCGACHTPKIVPRRRQDQRGICSGSHLQGWFAPEHHQRQEPAASAAGRPTISSTYLKTGHNRITAATGPMAEEIVRSRPRSMTDGDLNAIATYLKSLPGRRDSPQRRCRPSDPAMMAGAGDLPRPMLGLSCASTARACRSCFRRLRESPRLRSQRSATRHPRRAARRAQRRDREGADRAWHAVIRLAAHRRADRRRADLCSQRLGAPRRRRVRKRRQRCPRRPGEPHGLKRGAFTSAGRIRAALPPNSFRFCSGE